MKEQQGTSLAPLNYTQISVECKLGWPVRISQLQARYLACFTSGTAAVSAGRAAME